MARLATAPAAVLDSPCTLGHLQNGATRVRTPPTRAALDRVNRYIRDYLSIGKSTVPAASRD
jgi:hypothetical protein